MAESTTKAPSIEELTDKINELTSRNDAILKSVQGIRDITCECSRHIGRLDKTIKFVIDDLKAQEEAYCSNIMTFTDYEYKMSQILKELELIVFENERTIAAYALGAVLKEYS